jgi:hypothetical protein
MIYTKSQLQDIATPDVWQIWLTSREMPTEAYTQVFQEGVVCEISTPAYCLTYSELGIQVEFYNADWSAEFAQEFGL